MEHVTVTLCIGLVGVCILGLLGDENDIVFSDIEGWGSEDWLERLPAHDKPIEGIYSIDLIPTQKDEELVTYEIVGVNK